VVALDVGHGQLHPKVRDDPRVTVLERVNVRRLGELPFAPELITCDVSFISVRVALPPALALARPGWSAVVLIKPQFEAGREQVGKRGVVRDPEIWTQVLHSVSEYLLTLDAEPMGIADSGLPGPKGNREFFVCLRHRPGASLPDEFPRWIDEAIG